ncbi:MAG: cytochrome c3 family protein, partial [Myxococcales bacterium]|nr:cytochrome c3 family protein [Myxococcales bacterium]
VGDALEITYAITDDDGREFDVSELSGLSFQFSGPTDHYQNVIQYNQLPSAISNSVYNFDGTWTYTTSPIPANFLPPLNDTTDLGTDDGDWGGQPLVDGTYTVAAWATVRVYEIDGSSWNQAGNDTFDVVFGNATAIEPREVVLAENCAACHGPEFEAHGGSRRDLGVCLTCHVDGAEDRYSQTDPLVTPGVTISMRSMIHSIHDGEDLANGFEVAGYPADPNGVGYPSYNLHDYSEVAFPRWPTGTADCDTCHGGAADGDVNNRPTREDCGTCHDTIDFLQTDTGATDYHPGGPQYDDNYCHVCHNGVFVSGYHADFRDFGAVWAGSGHAAGKQGIHVEILDAVNGTGGTTFQVGDTITVHFTVKYDDGTDIPQALFAYSATASTCPTVSGGATLQMAGPSDHLQRVLYSPSPSSATVVGSVFGSSTVDGSGVWTYTLQDTAGTPYTIPATFPAQLNDSGGGGIPMGDLVGQPLLDGTYELALDMYTTLWKDRTCVETTRRRQSALGTISVLVGSATTLEPHDVVDDAVCETCHDNMEFHGASRIGTDYCVTCHTPGATDGSNTVSVDFPVMIHKLHSSGMLNYPYVVGSHSYSFAFPRVDGGTQACEACHEGNDAYLDPSARACVTCHDSDDTVAHAAINTDPILGESCNVCHGPTRQFSVLAMHDYVH